MNSLEDQLILHEGLKLKPYRCPAGKLTVGVGRNLDDVGIRPEETLDPALGGLTTGAARRSGVTHAQAMVLLRNDIAAAERDCDALIAGWRKFDPVRRKVVLDMAFNMGRATFGQFKTTIAAMVRRDWLAAAAGMTRSRWFGQVGDRGPRLVAMIQTGRDYDR